MTVDRVVPFVTGLMVLLSIGLANAGNPNWIWLAVFTGASLAQSGVTGFCPLSFVLKKLGLRDRSCC